ncbi:MAG TPA: RdgB/HAM1 family non-canonical purine NTP pyrophosphatase [Candidatus Acidoferrum sp.]|nr:RdgB/HAM1 family non-canonical purine NTP pyrophosphatase [Candidatus Acidoferrum sp.]
MRAPVKLFLASSNSGKVAEFRALAAKHAPGVEIALVPEFQALPPFDEQEPTIAENALGKALHYSRLAERLVFADDSGLVVRALGGAPGVHSARYAGIGAANEERIAKLLTELRGEKGAERAAYFVCVIALAREGRALAIGTDRVEGEILESQRGGGGFGYDPVFYFAPLKKTFAEIPAEQKNEISHRGKAFRKLLAALPGL